MRLWAVSTGASLRLFEGHQGDINDCTFSPDGKLVLSASDDKTLRLWDASTGQVIHVLFGHENNVQRCSFSPDGRFILSASFDKTVRVWDVGSGKNLSTHLGYTQDVWSSSFTPDGRYVISACGDHKLRLWRPENGELVARVFLPAGILTVGIHPWLPKVVCGCEGGAIYRAELFGIPAGPVIITALESEKDMRVHCPSCQRWFYVQDEHLGREVSCPTEGCSLQWKINPFKIKSHGSMT